ncbi:hypothetical protein Sked_21410 [Sanguibacter keddieii DSM 10542]|uniref:SRPBCC family protein n=1 Tax=Sanguibacter keddieii (strain ATCC 51767 / DSM 10542 / NCFB 3025 / ST-74) TaxID=446469 RepID=D1BHZ1_SANKS|nr:hypothetical protein [Sanguibacter keddieii]ACZ22061.1 hypothetical protein Sked_21410 [Sanguibacter keddieii DSM 10542]
MITRRPVQLALLAASAAAAATCITAARSAALGWGSTAYERWRPLPGDELVAHPDLVATRAITIDAPCREVWPWVVQVGQGRGGFYSYDRLENLAGLGVRSADRVMPELQSLDVGDTVRLAPRVALTVEEVVPGRAVVLSGDCDPTDPREPLVLDDHGRAVTSTGPAPYEFSWAFVLVPTGEDTCRLVVRERYGYTAAWSAAVAEPVGWVSAVMTQRMLRGIRDRAQGERLRNGSQATAVA